MEAVSEAGVRKKTGTAVKAGRRTDEALDEKPAGIVTAGAAGVAGGMRLSHRTIDHFLDRVEDAVEDELFHDEDEWWDFDHGGHREGGCAVFLD